MRRLLSILTTAATILSLLLCMATMAAWVRSYQASDLVWWSLEKPRFAMGITTYRGGSVISIHTPVAGTIFPPSPGAGWEEYAPEVYGHALRKKGTFFNRFGLALHYSENSESALRQLASPYWSILLLTAVLPGAWLFEWRRRARRLRPGLCQHCGYDCRATPDRCPECGNVSTDASA